MATKLKHNKNFCNIEEKNTLKEFLKEELFFSNKAIKTSYISKNALNMHLAQKSELYLPQDLLNRFLINPKYTGPEIEVIYEDDIFIVVNKPSGIHGHAMDYYDTNTVLNFLRPSYNLLSLGSNKTEHEKGLLYRLDKLTSGVLVFIKDEIIHQNLRDSFKQIAKEKTYLAVVEGEVREAMSLTHHLISSGVKGERVIVSDAGVEANLSFKPLYYQAEKNISLLEIKLKEGHRHQIRVQLASYGHAIVGDPLYNDKHASSEGLESKRLFLHAFKYGLEVNGHATSFRADKADLFCDLLNLNSLMDVTS